MTTPPTVPEAMTDQARARVIANAVHAWFQPHLKHIVSFNTLWECVENALASTRPQPVVAGEAERLREALQRCADADFLDLSFAPDRSAAAIARAALRNEDVGA